MKHSRDKEEIDGRLRQSSVTLHPKFTASLRPLCRPLPALKISLPSVPRRNSSGAAGAVMVDTVASSYAIALADMAQANNILEATITDGEKVERVFSDPTVQNFFANPAIGAEKKMEVVKEITKAEELQSQTAKFLNILVNMGRISWAKDMAKEFETNMLNQCIN